MPPKYVSSIRLVRYLGDVTDKSIRSVKKRLDSSPVIVKDSIYGFLSGIKSVTDIPLSKTFLVLTVSVTVFLLSEPRTSCYVSYSDGFYHITHAGITHNIEDTTRGLMRVLSIINRYLIGSGKEQLLYTRNGIATLDTFMLGPIYSTYVNALFMGAIVTSAFDTLRWIHDEFSRLDDH
jgi:hypothetical protein